ncbi:ngep-related [Anaeramoeba ignava]|uniref:Ngep-related n=1 Tax=Anaeramoeba ignava TaxID=1746090 RepID=A0A9Q0REK5_ANAIG|nr:ngep-related [Anaeramoeba ignava]|eukprot:Anaeramoba_ignava/a478382_442.p1 GENE.a478382_442~~a478382_442.p1  ORF type:complete len:682 (-),score=170.03 a478382_442:197-2242(-)
MADQDNLNLDDQDNQVQFNTEHSEIAIDDTTKVDDGKDIENDDDKIFYEWVVVFAEQDLTDNGCCKKVTEDKLEHAERKKEKIKTWLTGAGLKLRETSSVGNEFTFIEIGASNHFLERWAEKSKLRVKIAGMEGPTYLGYAEFRMSQKNMFLAHSEECVFNSSERQKIIRTVIEAKKDQGGCGINVTKLIRKKYATDMFSVHNYDELDPLLKRWSKSCKCTQPIDQVRDYFGENVAFYFTYLGFYTEWLIFLSIVSIPFGIVQIAKAKVDTPAILFYSLFIVLWTTVFVETWKRKSNTKALHWDTLFYEREEQIRPEFKGKIRMSPITNEEEPFYPGWKRKLKYIGSYFVIFCFITAAICASVFINKKKLIDNDKHIDFGYKVWTAVATGASIFVLNFIFQRVAPRLNDWENHETDTKYENALIVKFFLFQSINSWTSTFCIAFIAQDITYLTTHLGSLLIFRQALGNVQEVFLPYIRGKLKIRKEKKRVKALRDQGIDVPDVSMIEKQAKYPRYSYTIDDYSEMMIQFGYISLFSISFPAASILALLNNIIEIRTDSFKLKNMKRPEPRPANGIGSWIIILEILSFLIILSNIALVAVSSTEQLDYYFSDGISDTERLWFLIAVEHILIVLKLLLRVVIPDTSQAVDDAIAKDKYEAEKNQTLMLHKSFYAKDVLDDDQL